MGENENKPEEKPTPQTPEAPNQEELTPEKIRELPGPVRAQLCAIKCNEALKEYNCIYTPFLRLDNNGFHITVQVTGMAYEANLPAGTINPLMFNG